jgi:hypothetical protein
MKGFFLLSIFLILPNITVSAQVQKNMVKTFLCKDVSSITLALDGNVEIVEWEDKLVRLVTTVDALNFNKATLKALSEAGRYSFTYKEKDGIMILTMLKAQRELVIRGVKIQEKFNFKVFVPRGVIVEHVKHAEVAALF